jgi:hypothetical protein
MMKPIQPGRRRAAAPPTSSGRTARPLAVTLIVGMLALMTACGTTRTAKKTRCSPGCRAW